MMKRPDSIMNVRRFVFIFCVGLYGVITWVTWPEKAETGESTDFISHYQISGEVSDLLRKGCYDCHSLETKYPFYAYFPPISGWIQGHVDHGRGKLNFSKWPDYEEQEQIELIKTSIDEIQKNEMPPGKYVMMHEEAAWSEKEKELVIAYLNTLVREP